MRGKLYLTFILMAALLAGFLPAGFLYTTAVLASPQDFADRSPKDTPRPLSKSDQKNGVIDTIANTRKIVLRADANVSDLRLEPPPITQVGKAQATVTIEYVASGETNQLGDTCATFPDTAKAAFDAAANIWGASLDSNVPIVIEACWTSLPPGVLGHAGALSYHRNFDNAPRTDTWYPASLANALAGTDLFPGLQDMSIAYSSGFVSSFYYGTDGNVPANRYDFETIVLHEITHGLGFSGSMSVASGIGSWGYGGSPDAYDHFTQDQAANSLTNTAIYANPSTMLGSALTSGNVFFNGTQANAANGGQRVKLHAPAAWIDGSSYSHLDDVFNGTENALMTYSLSLGESLHNPGTVTTGILQDLGWLGSAPIPPSPTATATPSGSPTPVPAFSVSGRVTDDSGNGLKDVFFSFGQGTVATSDAQGNYTINGLTPGTYRIVPSKNSYVFSPPHIDVNVLTTNLANQNFEGIYTSPPEYSISGRISDEQNQPLSGVTISLPDGTSTTSDASGNYTLAGLSAGSFTVTPSKNGYTFMPASRTVSLTTGGAVSQDFIAHAIPLPTYTVGGQIKDTNGFALQGVTVSDNAGHSGQTDKDGRYFIYGLAAGTYDLMPLMSGYSFSPLTLNLIVVDSDQTDKDFTATALPNGPFSISGEIKDGSGTAISGVLVMDETGYSGLSDANGRYVIPALPVGNYTLMGVKSGFQLTAAFVNPVVITGADVGGKDFIGSAAPAGSNTISGLVSDAKGAALAGVTIQDIQGFYKTVSDANGQYILKDVPSGYYLLRAVHDDDIFAPALRLVKVPPDTTAQDFQRLEHQIDVNSAQDEHDSTPGDGQCMTTSGVCTLRAAIEEANAYNDADIIRLPAGTYPLSLSASAASAAATADDIGGSLVISASITILGEEAAKTVIDARGSAGVFEINQTAEKINVEMQGVTIQGGSGSGVLARSGDGILVLNSAAVQDNHASGILTHGFDVILEDSRVSGNKTYAAVGGMDVNGGLAALIDSTVSGNEGSGGGIEASEDLLMIDSTVSANQGTQNFGGLAAAGKAAIVNSTISGNRGSEGGGVWAAGETHFYNATIVKNEALGSGGGNFNSGLGGGIYVLPGSSGVTLHNTLLSENQSTQDAPDCFGVVNSAGYSLIGDKTGCTIYPSATDVVGYDPGIDGLDEHGGSTHTHAILQASWAIDAGNPAGCVDQNGFVQTHDQRGSPRPMDGKGSGLAICDIGSYEYQPVPSPYQIKGKITDDRFQALADATIFLDNGAQTISDRQGYYVFTGLTGGDYKITVTRKDYIFSPQARQVSLPPQAEGQDFMGIYADAGQYAITGRVQTAAGSAIAGVIVTLETGVKALTDGRGYYRLENVGSGVHTLTPSLRSYLFKPLKLTVNITGDLNDKDFIGTKK